MLISIIIVVYNGKNYLPDCLHSLQLQESCEHEIIVVDNASKDGSVQYIISSYPSIILMRNNQNIGFAAACNQGAEQAHGDILVFLNQDTRVDPGWLDGLLTPFVSDPAIGLVTSKLLLMSAPEKIDLCGQNIHFSGLPFARGILLSASEYNQLEEVCAVSGASFAIRHDLWLRLGGFDPYFFMYYEETDLSWRAWLAGFSSVYTPQSVAYHDDHLSPSINAVYYTARNRWVLLLKHWHLLTLLLLAPGLLLAEVIDWGVMAMYGRRALLAKLRSIVWVLRHLPEIFTRRQSATVTRVKRDWYLLRKCTPSMAPSVRQGGPFGRGVVLAANILFKINYEAALAVERMLHQ